MWSVLAAGELETIKKAAEQGQAGAQFSLGVMYDQGYGVTEDDAEALRWYRLAAEQGYAGAQYILGLMYAQGEGVPEDDAEAVRWYQMAAEQGFVPKLNTISVSCMPRVMGCQRMMLKPCAGIQMAAEQGYAGAQYNLGLMYAQGEGVPEDDAEAVRWYQMAAEQGQAGAQFNLGTHVCPG